MAVFNIRSRMTSFDLLLGAPRALYTYRAAVHVNLMRSPVAELTPEPMDRPSLWTGGSHRALCCEGLMLSPII